MSQEDSSRLDELLDEVEDYLEELKEEDDEDEEEDEEEDEGKEEEEEEGDDEGEGEEALGNDGNYEEEEEEEEEEDEDDDEEGEEGEEEDGLLGKIAAALPQAWGVLYAKPNPDHTPKRCDNCMMWSEDRKCSIHKEALNVPPDAICGYHVYGTPMEKRMDHPGMDPVDESTSGFDVVPTGTYCGICRFYEPTSGSMGKCWAVAKATGQPPQPVNFMGCCSRWEKS